MAEYQLEIKQHNTLPHHRISVGFSKLWLVDLLIYLAGELSTAFQVLDILVDRNELPMAMRVASESKSSELSHIAVEKVYHLLSIQGI